MLFISLINILTPWHLCVIIFYFFLIVMLVDNRYTLWYLRLTSYVLSLIIFFYSLFFFWYFTENCISFQYLVYFHYSHLLSYSTTLRIDGLSIFFILLTTFIIPICFLVSWNVSLFLREYFLCFFIIEFFLIIAFTTNDIFFFFIAFESILIPMFLIIGVWGSRSHKVIAAYWFFFFTLAGSIFFLYAISIFYFIFGTTNVDLIFFFIKNGYFNDFELSRRVWICLFIAFAVKIPLFPFHVWLPEAHVEAPTAGSVLLASLLLKLGGYGLIRFLLKLFPVLTVSFTPLVYTLCLMGILYTSLTAIRQLDLKRLIAYSSVAHMNYVVIGLFSGNIYGIVGGIQLMLSHGIISTALFILVGVLYDRYGVRLVPYFSGLSIVMPLFSCFFGLFIFSNAGFPLLSNFVGEFLIFTSFILNDLFFGIFIVMSLYFTGIYSVWLLNRVVFGNLNMYPDEKCYSDVTRREFFILFVLAIVNFFMGLYPHFFFSYIVQFTLVSNQYLFFIV